MSEQEFIKYKQKIQFLTRQIKQQDRIMKEYKETIEQSNSTIQDIMDKLSMEFKLANQIHRVLLPVDMPVIPHCEFSYKFRPAEVAGPGKDFYQIVPYSDKYFSIIMSSCLSHSLSALLFSARLKMMSVSTKEHTIKPDVFVSHLLKQMEKDFKHISPSQKKSLNILPDNIDLFYGTVNQKTYQLSYCLLGNIMVFVQNFKAKKVQLLSETKNKISPKKVHLNSKDRLIICSPGIAHALEKKHSLLKNIIEKEYQSPVHELRNRILFELDQFCQGTPRSRDQSILVMGLKSQILKLT